MKLTNSVCAILVRNGDNRILLQKRDENKDIPFPGKYCFFGGGLNDWETPKQALERELIEELSTTISASRMEFLTEMTVDLTKFKLISTTRLYYHIEIFQDDIESMAQREGSGMVFLSATDILNSKEIVPYDGYMFWLISNQNKFVVEN